MLSRMGSDLSHTRTSDRFNPKENKQGRYLLRPVMLSTTTEVKLNKMQSPPPPFISNYWECSQAPRGRRFKLHSLCHRQPLKEAASPERMNPPSLSCMGFLQLPGKHWAVRGAQQDTGLHRDSAHAAPPRCQTRSSLSRKNFCLDF